MIKFLLLFTFLISIHIQTARCQISPTYVDTLLARTTGAIFKDNSDTLSVYLRGYDLDAKIIFFFTYNSIVDSVEVNACNFPLSKQSYNIHTLEECLHYINSENSIFGNFGFYKVDNFNIRNYFNSHPRDYSNDEMRDLEIQSGVYADWHFVEYIKTSLNKSGASKVEIIDIVLDIYNTRNSRNEVTLHGPYEYIYTFAWSNVLNKAVLISSPYGL